MKYRRSMQAADILIIMSCLLHVLERLLLDLTQDFA